MKVNLLEQLEVIGPYLPPNTLDELIDELGGPDHVAEVIILLLINSWMIFRYEIIITGCESSLID